MKVKTIINELPYEMDVEPSTTLLELLRDHLKMIGTKCGCNEGECGACTVLLDGKPINSCLLLAVKANGRKIMTVEGLSNGKTLHPLQTAFMENGALQCGFCTPGMLLSSYALIQKNNSPSDEEIKKALAGNLCRCTGYQKIYDAVKKTAAAMRNERG